jgi:hypothetical protein
MELYSSIRKNETTFVKVNGWNWRTIMLSEVSQVQKDKRHMFFLICER